MDRLFISTTKVISVFRVSCHNINCIYISDDKRKLPDALVLASGNYDIKHEDKSVCDGDVCKEEPFAKLILFEVVDKTSTLDSPLISMVESFRSTLSQYLRLVLFHRLKVLVVGFVYQ
jgi:hypothetical protein